MASEYSYYSEDEHHEKASNRYRQQISGKTEQDVVPKDLPDELNDKKTAVKFAESEKSVSSDWSEQMRAANEKSGFTQTKSQAVPTESLHERNNSNVTEQTLVNDADQSPFIKEKPPVSVRFAEQIDDAQPKPKILKTVVFNEPEEIDRSRVGPKRRSTGYPTNIIDDEALKPPKKESSLKKINPALIKLMTRKSGGESGKKPYKKATPLVTQGTEHRLVYLNPKERARRDLENRHGKNIVKMAQASADRLNSTLESQMQNLGVSLGRSTTSVVSMLASPDRKKKKAYTLSVKDPVIELDDSFARDSFTSDRSLDIDLNMHQSYSSSPNRRLVHLAQKHSKLKKKVKQVAYHSSQRSLQRSLSRGSFNNEQARASRGPIESQELVQKMIEYDPEKARALYEIQSKPKMMLTEEELLTEQGILREKLKAVNQNLNRIVNKELASQQVQKSKSGNTQGAKKEDAIGHEIAVIDKQIENAKARKKVLKAEFIELEGKMTKYLSDPEANDKLILQLAYLDSMIKGEYIQIRNLNEIIDKFMKLDFTQKEVDGERRLVQIEDELMRIRIKDETIKLVNKRNETQRSEYEVKIAKAEQEKQKLAQELAEQNKNFKIRDIKPMLAQKFLGDAFHKMKDSVTFEYQTTKAMTSVHNIKMYQLKSQATQTKQKIIATKQSIQEIKQKIQSTQTMLQLLEDERFNQKKKRGYAQYNEDVSNGSPDARTNVSPPLQPKKYTPSMKPPVPGQPRRGGDQDRVEDSEVSIRNIRGAGQMSHNLSQQDINADLNMSQAFNPRRRLNSAQRSVTSKSLTRLNSHRSSRSQKSLEKLEKGWSTKFKKAKALEEKPVNPLARPFSSKKNQEEETKIVVKQMDGPKKDMPQVKQFSTKEKMEYRSLKRRFGNQPANFSQVKKQKIHELVDDRENDPADREPARAGRSNKKPEWDGRVKPDQVTLPQLPNLVEKSRILRGSASVDRYQRMRNQEDEEDQYPASRQVNYIRHRYQDKSSNQGTPKRLAGARLKFPEPRRHSSQVRERAGSLDPSKVIYKSNYQSTSQLH